jgi:hypothetical protein
LIWFDTSQIHFFLSIFRVFSSSSDLPFPHFFQLKAQENEQLRGVGGSGTARDSDRGGFLVTRGYMKKQMLIDVSTK